jgi:tRNA-dihydrouridine synthase
MNDPAWIVDAWRHTGAEAVMLARGALGNPWLFARLLEGDDAVPDPSPEEVRAELDWVMDRAVEHLGPVRAGRYLRKFYPWYVERLVGPAEGKQLNAALFATSSVEEARQVLEASWYVAAPS